MCVIDLNEQFIVYAIYNGEGKWYISDKEIWYLDYKKRVEAYRKIGCEIKEEYIDERRRNLLCLEEDSTLLFLKRIVEDEWSTSEVRKIFFNNQENDDYKPSLYVDFDKKILYSMYVEPASYEDYVPTNWYAKHENFLNLIPVEKCYWIKGNHLED